MDKQDKQLETLVKSLEASNTRQHETHNKHIENLVRQSVKSIEMPCLSLCMTL